MCCPSPSMNSTAPPGRALSRPAISRISEVLPDTYQRVDGAGDTVELHGMDSREWREHVQLAGHHGFEFERIRESLDVRVIKSRLVDERPERGLLRAENLLRPNAEKGFSRDTCKNAPYNLFSLVDSFGCRIFLGASSVSAIGSQLRQQLLQRGHTHVGPQRLGLCLFATLPLLR